MKTTFLMNHPEASRATILLAHGAGAPMDSASMNAIATALEERSITVARFEFAYMALRRTSENRPPPPRADRLMPEYLAAIEELNASGPLIIGGKSMGARVATMIADDCYAKGSISGVLCLGYPFHPPSKPENLRTAHLVEFEPPALIIQGTRDPFGNAEEAANYTLAPSIEIAWLEDGDHDLKPRKRVTGLSHADHMSTMAENVSNWLDRVI